MSGFEHPWGAPPVSASWQCRLCASNELELRFAVRGCRLARCRRCDLTQVVDPISAAEIRSIYSPTYFSHAKYRDRASLRRENRSRLRLVRRFVKDPQARILEAGCGTGDFISIAKHAFDLAGFDLSRGAVDIARRANPEIADRIWCRDLAEVELPGSHFDAVCLWDVIEHVWDVKPISRKLLDSLKPGGFLFLSTPDIGSLMGRALGRFWPLMTPPEHVSFFSPISLSHLFENRLKSAVVYSCARGKWVNLRFAFRKIQNVMPANGLSGFFRFCQSRLPANLSVYLPSHDIRYAVVKKTAAIVG
jgi:2-polyprenyl-3-methyl-5-hydroxy-6-metoxy-1,4-benzoquinol methylase